MTKSIMLVGVGGQGTILASKLLTTGLMEVGYDVKMSEIHGMSQRGGAVSSQVRYGKEVQSPVIEIGGADILVSFELMEAMRWIAYLKPGGKIVVNNETINSMPILNGKAEYPEGILSALKSVGNTNVIEATKEAESLGNVKVANVILLGAIIKSMNLESIDWHSIIKEHVNPKFVDLNLRALEIGMSLA